MKRLPIRGGNWNNGSGSGVFALNLNNLRSNTNTNIGARPAFGDSQKRAAYWASRQRTPQKDAHSPATLAIGQNAETLNRRAVPVAPCSATVRPRRLICRVMAKTYNNLYSQVHSFEALHAAYLRARKGKRQREEVQRFEQDLEGNLFNLQNHLIWGSYRMGDYRTFQVSEPKERQVASLPFADRVVQHALVAVIEPIWERRFVADSYACRPRKGTHRGADRAQAMMRSVKRTHGKVYALKADISKYFASIDHAVLRDLLRKRIACKRTLAMLDAVIDSANQITAKHGVGLPIGNLTSQLFANIYLHELDEFVKHGLREKNYARYMDDFVVLHHDKAHLQRVRSVIEAFLEHRLHLRTNQKTQVFPVSALAGRALDFLGYRIWPTHRRLRVGSIARIKRTMTQLRGWFARGMVSLGRVRQSVASWLAHAQAADTHGLRTWLLNGFVFSKGAV